MLAALPGVASADPVKVAVVPGIAVNLDAARVDALSQQLAEALHAALEVDAIGGVEVRRRLPEGGLPPDCVASDACIADVARRLAAQQILFVVMVGAGAGGAIQIDSTWVDPATGRSASRPAINIATIAEVAPRFAAAAQQLLPDAPVRSRQQAPSLGRMSEAVPRHFTTPSFATAGAAVAGLATGVSLGLVTRKRYEACKDLADDGAACSQGRRDSIRRLAAIADLGWVVAVGGTIATAVLYTTSGEAPHVLIEPTPGGAAVTAIGRF